MNTRVKDRGCSYSKIFIVGLLLLLQALTASLPVQSEELSSNEKEEIKSQIDNILGSQEFAEQTESGGMLRAVGTTIKAFVDHLKELYNRLMGKIKFPRGNLSKLEKSVTPGITILLRLIGMAVILILLLIIFYIAARNLRMPRKIKQLEDKELLSVLRNPEEVETRAMKFYSEGDFKQALRFLFIALLIKLNELNRIKIDKSKTNRQYILELQNGGYPFADIVQVFSRAFDEHWYGNRPIKRDKVKEWFDKYNFLIKEVKL